MSNYIINQKNELIDNSSEILRYLTGMYMDQYRDCILAHSGDTYRLGNFAFNRLLSIHKAENGEELQKRISAAVSHCLSALFAEDCSIGYFISSDGATLRLTLAVEEKCSFDAARYLCAAVPGLKVSREVGAYTALLDSSTWGGVVINIPPLEGAYLDHVMEVLSGVPGRIGIVAFPSTRASSYISGLHDLSTQIESLGDFSYTYGSGSRRTIKASFPGLAKLGSYLKTQTERWAGIEEMWEGCIWFSSDTEAHAEQIGAILTGALGGQSSATSSPCMYFLTEGNPFQTGLFEVPASEYGRINFRLPEGLIKSPLETFFTRSDFVGLLQLPTYSHRGFDVLNTSAEPNPMRPFDIGGDFGGELTIGRLTDTGEPFCLRINDLTEHTLVTGATGSGKTNTVMKIVDEVYRNRIPYCIIEPSKKDYWFLSGRDATLQVYSAGQDAKPLKINPFIPENGIDIGAHISALMYAFSGAFEMEPPTRYALEGLLKYSYRQLGWDMSELYHGQKKQFPQFYDLVSNLPHFMECELKYGQEVSDNILGALQNRLNSMTDGILSRIVNCSKADSLSGERICTQNTLLELDDLPLDTKPFVAELVLLKVSQYLRRQNPAPGLRNIIVLEEAHNVLPEILHSQRSDSRTIASEYFSNMLSEIREYGTGLIIADQGGSRINSNAVANTKVKILHSVASREDALVESYAMHLDDRRMGYLPGFHTGEALVAVRGAPHVWDVQVSSITRNSPKNIACLFCSHKQLCGYDEILSAIPAEDSSLEAAVYAAMRTPYDMSRWDSALSWVKTRYALTLSDSECLLGYLLDTYAKSCGGREKRRILYLYYNKG